MSEKMVVICNNAQTGIMPTLIMGSSGVTLDYETILFFCPGSLFNKYHSSNFYVFRLFLPPHCIVDAFFPV